MSDTQRDAANLWASYRELMTKCGPYGPQTPADQAQYRYQRDALVESVGPLLDLASSLRSICNELETEVEVLRSDFAALEDHLSRYSDIITQDWIDLIDSAPPPTEPQAKVYHDYCDRMLRDYAAALKKMSRGE